MLHNAHIAGLRSTVQQMAGKMGEIVTLLKGDGEEQRQGPQQEKTGHDAGKVVRQFFIEEPKKTKFTVILFTELKFEMIIVFKRHRVSFASLLH